MTNLLGFPGGGRFHTGGDSGGPEDPELETRVNQLEDDVREMKTSLKAIELGIAEMRGRFNGIDAQLSAINGQISGINARFTSLPTIWTMLVLIFSTWGIGSGILIFALNFLRR